MMNLSYESHWGFARKPFENLPLPEFFYRSETHQAAVLKLRYAVENMQGAVLLTGGLGLGKSYLAKLLAHELSPSAGPFIHVLYPALSPAELLAYVLAELTGESDLSESEPRLDRILHRLESELGRLADECRHPVIVIDDAHTIGESDAFRTLPLLLNFCERPGIRCSLVLVGDRTLIPQVARIGELDERIAVRSLLRPLSFDETADYVEHRLAVAGRRERIFENDALRSVFEISQGVPRRINRLCDLALLVGYADNLTTITADHVEAVAEDLLAAAA
jgi:type II secretory pathway predicted ATPase ExeA